ncbi:SET domain protein [Ceratobasidium sp. AG-Ba]|nr:SET domain protein [Ceratobasidium sp. AG-Ba]
MVHTLLNNHVFELKSDSRARSRAVAVGALRAGTNVLVESPLAVTVHPSHKTRRCDECLREADGLQKCSGCGVYYYCGKECQTASWKRHHRRLCRFSKDYVQSDVYKEAPEDARADVFLLAHLAAEHFYKLETLDDAQTSANDSVRDSETTILCRSFNHSCKPNAAAMFEHVRGGIRMVVKLLEDVANGEEIFISYIDPAAPYSKRRDALAHVYGFSCQCSRCTFDASTASVSPTNQDRDELRHRIGTAVQAQIRNEQSTLEVLRDELRGLTPILDHELLRCLPDWTSEFSSSSHDGPYDKALEWGNAVLGVYVLVYPGIHPLLELHCLELCKVAWNHYITSVAPGRPDAMHVKGAASAHLRWAKSLSEGLHEGLEVSRSSVVSEYDVLESCLREE